MSRRLLWHPALPAMALAYSAYKVATGGMTWFQGLNLAINLAWLLLSLADLCSGHRVMERFYSCRATPPEPEPPARSCVNRGRQ